MKLCLYNVENLFLINPGIGDSFKKPLDKVEWVARTIKEIDADVTMLCEVGGLASLDLFNSKYLGNAYHTALLPGNSDRGIEMGYLIHKRLSHFHEIISHRQQVLNFHYPHELALPADHKHALKQHRFSRDISELRLIENQKIKLIVLLVHLKSKLDKEGIDYNGNLRRKAECLALIETYKRLKKEHAGTPIIVAGDMNGRAQKLNPEPELKPFYDFLDLEDVLEVINEPLERRSTYFHFNR